MIILYTGILLILYSLVSGKRYKPHIGFFFVFIIMAFQSNVQGDYMGYMDTFIHGEEIRTAEEEPLWSISFNIFRPVGWYVFVFCLSFFQYFVLVRLTKRFVNNQYQWQSAVLFFFTFGLMLIQMKAMRQALSIELSLLPFIFDLKDKKRKWMYCFVPIVLAYFTHNSAIITLPVVILYYLQITRGVFDFRNFKRLEFFYPTILTVAFLVLYQLRSTILVDYLIGQSKYLTDFRLSGYMDLSETQGNIFNLSLLIVAGDAFFIFFMTWYFRFANGLFRPLVIMAIASLFLNTMFFGMGALARMGYYYLVATIVVYPNVAGLILKRFGKVAALTFIAISIAYAIKTALPWIISSELDRFGNYKFYFMQ